MEQHILVVDDEASVRELVQAALEGVGYRVWLAGEAEEASQLAASQRMRVMFLDLHLPGQSGLELGRRLRQADPLCILHAMTGLPSLFQLVDCREAGFDDYFLKPLDLATLIKAARQAFEKLERWRGGGAKPPQGQQW